MASAGGLWLEIDMGFECVLFREDSALLLDLEECFLYSAVKWWMTTKKELAARKKACCIACEFHRLSYDGNVCVVG